MADLIDHLMQAIKRASVAANPTGTVAPAVADYLRAERARTAAWERERAEAYLKAAIARVAELHAQHADLLTRHDGTTIGRIVALHAPDGDGCCLGDDMGGGAAEAPDWPCRTVDVITGADHG